MSGSLFHARDLVVALDDVRARLADLADKIEPTSFEIAEYLRETKLQLAAVQDRVEHEFDV